ncbi:choline transporter [Marinicauda salina]|uniref:Choline transporter n=1 Tax=Marinicauda salina TaxID=2135793 RepID=A0A2U2BWE4_9PROT|nr:BCCT family transporter [Marinicauda salina]PWE18310.1 choline transporter [Marinicauda salina]
MEPPVFFGSAGLVVVFVLFGGLWTGLASDVFQTSQEWVSRTFGWWYMLAATGFLVLGAFIALTPARRIRFGGPKAKPDFNRSSWIAMLFAAGMGTGLVFWSVAEPLLHYVEPPPGVEDGSAVAAREAMRLTFFHWGLNAWGIYLILGLAVAYFHFNQDLPLAPRSALHPLIGDRIYGPIGHVVDTLCTVGALLGVATSLGLGAMQVNVGLSRFFDFPQSTAVQVSLIAIITAMATVSVVMGVQGGVRRLSLLNIMLAALLMVFVFIAGPTQYILETLVSSTGLYIQKLPRATLFIDFARSNDWQATWTFFYWGWWISWSPFVAIFLARISKGRTIGEFILTALIVPTGATFLWLAVFGGSALHAQIRENAGLAQMVQERAAVSLHALLDTLPLATATLIFATLVIVIFFVTSSDSGSLVDDMVTSGGDPHPPRAQRVFWAVSEGAVAATLLLVGGLTAIRNAAITLGLPMSLVLVAAAFGLIRGLRLDRMTREAPKERPKKTSSRS